MRRPLSALVLVLLAAPLRAEDAPTWDTGISGLFREHCGGCHNPDRKRGGLDLTSHAALLAGGSSGESVAPGDAEGSYLFQLVTHASEPRMPPETDKLPDEAIDRIRRWIAAGATERGGGAPVRKKPVTALAAAAVTAPSGPLVAPPRMSLQVRSTAARPATVTALDASPHGDVAATGGRGQVLLHDLAAGGGFGLLGVLPFPEGVVKTLRFSPDGRLLLAGGGEAAKSGRVVVWDVATAARVAEFGAEFDEVLAADVAPDRRLAALGGPAKVVRIFATADASLVGEVRRHTDWITALAFSPDSVLLASGDRAGNLFVWESHSGAEYAVLKGHKGPITALEWRADGDVVASASGDGTVKLWEVDSGKLVKSFDAHAGGVESLAWLPDGRLVTTGRDAKVRLWTADGKPLKLDVALADMGTRVTTSRDGSLLLVGDHTGTVTVFGSTDGLRIGSLDTNPPRLEAKLERARTRASAAEAAEREAADAAAKATEAATAARAALDAARAEERSLREAIEFDAAQPRP